LSDWFRQSESLGLATLRQEFAAVTDLAGGGARIEGGDVLVLEAGQKVLVGMNRHTNLAGIHKLTEVLRPAGTDVVCVPHSAVHLDCCVSPLPSGDALVAAARLPAASMATLGSCFGRLIPLDDDEARRHLAANLFWLDERRVVSGSACTQTNTLLRELGYDVIEVTFSAMTSLWGGVRCSVCPIERAAR